MNDEFLFDQYQLKSKAMIYEDDLAVSAGIFDSSEMDCEMMPGKLVYTLKINNKFAEKEESA